MKILAPLGLTTTEMAAACGTGDNVIRARLADVKKKTKGKKESLIVPEDAEGIVAELRRISRLLAATSLRDLNQREKIELLSTVGFPPKEIAELIGTTPNTVSVTLVKMKSRSKKRPKSGEKEGE